MHDHYKALWRSGTERFDLVQKISLVRLIRSQTVINITVPYICRRFHLCTPYLSALYQSTLVHGRMVPRPESAIPRCSSVSPDS